MKKRQIFRHPVGVFPMGARWYLAAIAMLALLGVAAHLSVQMQAQQMAEKLLQQWGKKAQVQIGDVHYHLLRNGLIVKNIQISRQSSSLSIAHMLIRANPRLLTGNAPQIGDIEIDGVQIKLRDLHAEQTWLHDEYLLRIWQASRSLNLRNGQLEIFPQGEATAPLKMTGLELHQDFLHQQRSLVGTAHTGGGKVSVQWQVDERFGSSSGRLRWPGVEAGLVATLFGLRPVAGLLTGVLNWTWQDSARPGLQTPTLDGHIQLDNADDQANESHQLHVQGLQADGIWQLELQAKAWPLDAWADRLPRIGGRQLLAGQLDGVLQWRGQAEKWNINASQGVLHNIRYARNNEPDATDWRAARLEYQHLVLDQEQRRFQAAKILLADADITLQPGQAAVESAQQKFAADWRVDVDDIRIQHLNLALSLPQGEVRAPILDGKGRWKAGEALNITLQTQNAGHKAEQAEGKEAVETGEQWQLGGQLLRKQTRLNDVKLNLQVRNVSLEKLRALIPLSGSKTSPLTLEGKTSLTLDVSVRAGIWQAAGTATAGELLLAHAGDVWRMDHLSVAFGPVGMGLDKQSIDLLEVQGWKFITALIPLPAHQAETTDSMLATEREAAWWARLLREQQWKIDTVSLQGGVISLGRSEDDWARQIDISLDHIQADQWATLNIVADIGSGVFNLKGEWDALGEANRFRGAVSLKNALPFFMHNWMTASGMPRLLRGRIFADLSVDDGDAPDSYRSVAHLKLLRGLTEMSPFPDDPLLTRLGLGVSDTLHHLDDGAGMAALQFEINGLWNAHPLNLDQLGASMQRALEQVVLQGPMYGPFPLNKKHFIETRIRLHEKAVLSLNERIRLFKAVRVLRKHPDWVVDLIPRWSGDEMNEDVLQRVFYTQHLIERYLLHRKVRKQRIFPLWPIAENHADDIGSVWVSIGPPV